jgi:hypothetical protein
VVGFMLLTPKSIDSSCKKCIWWIWCRRTY